MKSRYVLISAVWDEEKYIQEAIESILCQTCLPQKWFIVSDGSTDRTEEIVKTCALEHSFIELVHRDRNLKSAGFSSKAHALNDGAGRARKLDCEFIGHLDGDVSFDSDYYERQFEEFRRDPKLGITGGFIYELSGSQFVSRPTNRTHSVAGAIQLFRRSCYEDIGSFVPMAHGGEDWYAEIAARMHGWTVRACPELKVLHHKSGAGRRGRFKEHFRQGVMDYSFGSHPIFEIAKRLCRIPEKPLLLGAGCGMAGFFWSMVTRRKLTVPKEVRNYLRQEQLGRVRTLLRWPPGRIS